MRKLGILFLFMSSSVFAGDLVSSGGIVTSVTALHTDTVSLTVSGGVNNICEDQTINFKLENMTGSDPNGALQRIYSTILTAFSTNTPVRIHLYIDNNCSNAQFIKLSK